MPVPLPACDRPDGWADALFDIALAAYESTVDLLGPDWPRPEGLGAKRFFETKFQTCGTIPALITGYYEPELDGAEKCCGQFRYPLYSLPANLPSDRPWLSRSEIEESGALMGEELVWLRSPVEVFFAQVQGSVRVRLPDGKVLRFGYAGKNGHEYRSIGVELVQRGAVDAKQISAQAIRNWCAAHPDGVETLLRHNPSFVFFRTLDLPATSGPLGAMGRSVTAGCSVAVDPTSIPLGSPVWVKGPSGGQLMIAQDIGSAITGPGRVDVFCGTGPEAGEMAGKMNDSGIIVPFTPRLDEACR